MIDPDGHNLAFILGLPRSGTTLLSVILDRHPQVHCPPEPWIMLALESVGKVCVRHPADSHLLGQAVSEFCDGQTAIAGARAYAAAVYNQKLAAAGKSIFVDKTPRYYHILPFVRQTFREAKWIWLQRNPLDVAASYKAAWKIDFSSLLGESADYPIWNFDLVIGLERLTHEMDPGNPRVLAIQYEHLVGNPEAPTARIMRFLGLEPIPGQCEFDVSGSPFATSFAGDKKIAGTARPHVQSVGSWRRAFSRDETQILADFIGFETLRQLGYCQTIEELRDLGIVDNGPHAMADRREQIHQLYADRWADVQAAARDGIKLPWILQIEAERAEQSAAVERLTAQLGESRRRESALEAGSQRLTGSLARQADELQRVNLEAEESRANAEARYLTLEQEAHAHRRELGDLRRTTAEQAVRLARQSPAREPLRQRLWRQFSFHAQRAIIGFPHARGKNKDGPLPRITIVTPVFNGEAYIREAIQSVLSQGYPNLQYIIVDGGSTDRTLDIVNEFKDRISRVISEKDNGMYDAVGKGFELADGEVLGYLNCDDLFEAGGLLRVGEFFRDHPRAQVEYHEDTVWHEGWKFPNAAQPPRINRMIMLKGHTLFQDGVFFRRRAYQAVGGLDRTLRRAGDWDLWVRLSGMFPMRRARSHVSCFRIRSGQISGDLASYNAELHASRARSYQRMGTRGILLSRPRYLLNRAINLLWCKLCRRRLFFPISAAGCAYGERPAPGTAPPYIADEPRCPLTGERADRLLFSSRDTRFGDELINYIYHSSRSDLAITYPALSKEQLNGLYERHYSNPDARIIPPPDGYVSPYRNFRGGTPFDKLIARSIIPPWISHGVDWGDTTCRQLLDGVKLPVRGGGINFLDVGCFDGKLLSAIARKTDWKTCGLEPNAKAAMQARAAGHQVWQGFAEDASFVIPEDISFDAVHLGQTIEHLGDPLTVVRRLRGLLKPGGLMILSTPNLHSKQIDLFGPTWSHWHPPYHRFVFSPKSLKMMAALANLRVLECRSYSHPYWTCMSVQLNRLGVGAAVPHTVEFPMDIVRMGQSLTFWSKWLWDWRGKGDYLVAVFRKK